MKTVEVIVVAHIQNQTWVSKPKWYLSPLFWGRTMSRWTLPTRKAQTYNVMGDGSSVSFHAAVIKDVVGRCQPQTTSGSEQECPRPSFQRPVLWLKIPSGLMLKKSLVATAV